MKIVSSILPPKSCRKRQYWIFLKGIFYLLTDLKLREILYDAKYLLHMGKN